MGQTSLKAKGFSSLKIRSREVRSAVVFEKKENWPQPEKPKRNLHWNWVLSLGGTCYDNSPSHQRRSHNTGSTSPSRECWRDVPPDRRQETNGVQWQATKKKELSQKWRNAICMASCMLLQSVSPRVKKALPKQPPWQGWRSEAAMGGSATNIHWSQSAFPCYYAHSAFKMFITIQNYLIYFVSFLSVFPSGLQGHESLVHFAYHHSLTSENDAPHIIRSTKKTFEQWVGERASEQVCMVSPQLQWDRCISPSLIEGERKA